MASIEKRTGREGKTVYRVRVRLKGYPIQTATFERKTDAKRWAQQTESAILEGRHFNAVEAKRHTLGELIDRYIRDVLPHKKGKRDTLRYLRWWQSEIGDLLLADIRPAQIGECRDKFASAITVRGRKRSNATVIRCMAALSHALTVAVKEWGWIDNNPMLRVTKPKEPRGRVRFLSDDERGRLLDACKQSDNPFLYPAVVLSLSTGARQQEIMKLRWRDVDLQRGMITLHDTKNGDRRGLPLVGYSLSLVKELGKVRRLDTDLLFPSHVKPYQPVDLRFPWKKALKEAGIHDFRWHDLRHSAASYLAMNGASIAEIADILGHRTLQMVKRYTHLSEQHTAGVLSRMNEKIFNGE